MDDFDIIILYRGCGKICIELLKNMYVLCRNILDSFQQSGGVGVQEMEWGSRLDGCLIY